MAMGQELETYYILLPSDRKKLLLDLVQQQGWQGIELLPGEYFLKAFEQPRRKRKPKSDSGEWKVEEWYEPKKGPKRDFSAK